ASGRVRDRCRSGAWVLARSKTASFLSHTSSVHAAQRLSPTPCSAKRQRGLRAAAATLLRLAPQERGNIGGIRGEPELVCRGKPAAQVRAGVGRFLSPKTIAPRDHPLHGVENALAPRIRRESPLR